MKKIFIALVLCLGVQTQADAQFLKKLGDAIEKGAKKLNQTAEKLDKALGGSQTQGSGTAANASNQTNKEDQMIGQTVKIGQSTLAKFGDNPCVDINWQGLYRIYGSTIVSASFQLINMGELRVSVSWHDSARNYALDTQGRQYRDEAALAANRTVGPYHLEPGAKALYSFNYEDVPASVQEMQMVLLGVNSNLGQQTGGHHYSFRINDAPISILPAVTAKGIYGQQKVLIGQTIASLPKVFPYVYDAYTVSTEEDEGETTTIVTFTLNGQETMTAISNDNKTIANIDIRTSAVYAKVGRNYYCCGNQMRFLKGERGTSEDPDYGQVSYQGIYFDKDEQGNICAIHI